MKGVMNNKPKDMVMRSWLTLIEEPDQPKLFQFIKPVQDRQISKTHIETPTAPVKYADNTDLPMIQITEETKKPLSVKRGSISSPIEESKPCPVLNTNVNSLDKDSGKPMYLESKNEETITTMEKEDMKKTPRTTRKVMVETSVEEHERKPLMDIYDEKDDKDVQIQQPLETGNVKILTNIMQRRAQENQGKQLKKILRKKVT